MQDLAHLTDRLYALCRMHFDGRSSPEVLAQISLCSSALRSLGYDPGFRAQDKTLIISRMKETGHDAEDCGNVPRDHAGS